MKRSFLSVVMFLSLSTVGYSQENKLNVGDWNLETRLPKLSRYLNLNAGQYDDVANAIDFFSDKMRNAKYSKENRQIKKLNEAVYGNLKLMKNTLSHAQYKKYVLLMNCELKNRGLNNYMSKLALNK